MSGPAGAVLPNINPDRATVALLLFAVLMAVATYLVADHEISKTAPGRTETLIAIGQALAPMTIVAAALTVILVEGVMVVIEGYLKRRYERGLAEGFKRANTAWRKWDERRRAAEQAGGEFNEDPPVEQENAN